jgi:hypothetical protein
MMYPFIKAAHHTGASWGEVILVIVCVLIGIAVLVEGAAWVDKAIWRRKRRGTRKGPLI